MDRRPNLQLVQASTALDVTNGVYIELREEVVSAAERMTDILAALRAGRLIDAHEALLDVRADLRAALNISP